MSDSSEKQLRQCRERIDSIDNRILELMEDRLKVAEGIGQIKQGLSEPAYYRPEREAQVLDRLRQRKPAHMTMQDLESLFRVIMSITRNSETGLSVALVGLEGSRSEVAARQHFGESIQVVRSPTIPAAIQCAQNGQANFVLIAVDDFLHACNPRLMAQWSITPLFICAEILLPVSYHLATAATSLQDVCGVTALPQMIDACWHWLDQHLAGVERISCESRSKALEMAVQSSRIAAIVETDRLEPSQLPILVENIQDQTTDFSRFWAFSTRDTPPSGDDKTNFLIMTRDYPGTLLGILKALDRFGVEVAQIASQDSSFGTEEHWVLMEVRGHQKDDRVSAAMDEIQAESGQYCRLGSYPATC